MRACSSSVQPLALTGSILGTVSEPTSIGSAAATVSEPTSIGSAAVFVFMTDLLRRVDRHCLSQTLSAHDEYPFPGDYDSPCGLNFDLNCVLVFHVHMITA